MRCLYLLILFSLLASCSPVNKYIRQANKKTEKGDLEAARVLFLKAYQKDSSNLKANAGLGIVLAEYMAKYEEALPYLEKAERLSSKDTLAELFYCLGKSYQYNEEFDKAIINFNKMKHYDDLEEDNAWFKMDVEKRIEDCNYAKTHTSAVNGKDYYVVNIGSKINTTAPEYVPIITPNKELLFTSKRKDSKKEKINPLDGKYFENMYLSKINGNSFTTPEIYTIPIDHLKKGHESIVSISPNGQKIFTYHNTKLYETDKSETNKSPKKLTKKVNLDYYQNHAYLTKDEKTLYFTSEQAKGGVGGNDIYKITKNENGTWGEPENLGITINTKRDEDSPYVSDDGNTLYFASNGHPGYGSYDIYKSTFENGAWTEPVNLGKPLNTVGHDIFLTNTNDAGAGYFASNRKGGKGDMDIYKVNYKPNNSEPCSNFESDFITINSMDENPNDFKQQFSFELDERIKDKVIDFSWTIAEDANLPKEQTVEYTFIQKGNYPIQLRVVNWCDTCLSPVVTCKQIMTEFKIYPHDPLPPKDLDIVNIAVGSKLTKDQLIQIGFDVTPLYFDFNKAALRDDATNILDKNNAVLQKYPMLSINLIGNTDARASENYNNQLSKDRAIAAKNYLVKNGFNKKRILSIKGNGKSQLVNTCKGEECEDALHQLNRRVEFEVIKLK